MNGYKIRSLDLDTRFEYLIIYKNKDDDSISTWTLGNGFLQNYRAMAKDSRVKILGVYRQMSDAELEKLKEEII